MVYNCGRALTGFGDPVGNPVVATLKNIFLNGTQKIIKKANVLLIVAKKETVTVILQIE